MATFLGFLTVIWYNIVYTYLKRISSLAVIPGSLIGALPPLVGWASSGSSIFSPRPLGIALFFFIWQIPHFWLLLLNFGGDYEKTYSNIDFYDSDEILTFMTLGFHLGDSGHDDN